MKIWVDILSPPHVLFLNSLLNELNLSDCCITVRDRAENIGLMQSFGLRGRVIGKDYQNGFKKSLNYLTRTLVLLISVKSFEIAVSQENVMSVAVAKIKNKKSISFCDNDLKFKQNNNIFQKIESKVRSKADYIFVPLACEDNFKKNIKNKKKIISYNGFKEDIYVADYRPDSEFLKKVSYDEFVVLRPEALGSFYVNEKKSLVPDLLRLFSRENINVIYLPRDRADFDYAKEFDVYIPRNPLNGLDLCYYSDVVLTGSGTMAREAACLGKPSVSFFPGKKLLSVDRKLIEEQKMLHSRDPEEITNYVLSKKTKNNESLDLQRSKNVKKEVVKIIDRIIHEN